MTRWGILEKITENLYAYSEVLRVYNVKLLIFSFSLIAISMGFLSWYIPILANEWFYYWAPIIYALLLVDDALFSLISGTLADIWGRKKLLLAGTLFYPFGLFLLVLGMSINLSIAVVLGLILALGVSSVASPAATTLLMESVDTDKRARSLSIFFLIENVVLSVGSFLFSYLLIKLGPLLVFLLIFILTVFATQLRLFVKETLKSTVNFPQGKRLLRESFKIAKNGLLQGPKRPLVRYLLIFSTIIGIAHGAIAFVVPLFLSQELGFNEMELGFLYALIPLLRIPLSLVSGPLSDKNPYVSLIIGNVISGLMYLFLLISLMGRWVSAIAMVVAAALVVFHGVAYSKIISVAARRSGMATLFGLSHFTFCIGMPIGSFLLGRGYYWIGELPIIIASTILMNSLILIIKIKKEIKKESLESF